MTEEKKKFFRKPTKKEVFDGFFIFLIFIIILGSLFWFSIFSLNVMQSTSRINNIKKNHSQTIEYISAELQICIWERETTAMDGGITCSGNTAAKTVTAAVSKMKDKNPYVAANNAVRSSTSNTNDEDVGYVSLSASGSDIIIKSCHKTPCNKEANRQSSTLNIRRWW